MAHEASARRPYRVTSYITSGEVIPGKVIWTADMTFGEYWEYRRRREREIDAKLAWLDAHGPATRAVSAA